MYPGFDLIIYDFCALPLQKLQFKLHEADEFERAWLLLADIYIQGGKQYCRCDIDFGCILLLDRIFSESPISQ